ncbi:hypothetical protein AYO44_00940 [Planctomycetaceae bacterium SCGC AG-212-F19]|nr:hypothetical protein AYO44_00940 [Planctomycetaceae bacterium SCGC AG-212-F19]
MGQHKLVGVLLLACMLSTGCIKIRLTVQLNEDGSGQVVEDIVFGEKLVDATKRLKDVPSIEELTGDEQLKKRLAHMGKGVKLAGKKVEKQTDGSVRLVATYPFEDINDLKLPPIPYGPGWEDVHLAFKFRVEPNLDADHHLGIRFHTAQGKERGNTAKPELPPLTEREAQQIRQLLPVFKDMLEGFELKVRLEIYDPNKWASTTKGHMASGGYNPFASQGGRQTFFQITDKHLLASDDGLMLVVPWRHVGRESDLYHHNYPPGPRLLPHINYYDRGGYNFHWRAIQTPRGREYY